MELLSIHGALVGETSPFSNRKKNDRRRMKNYLFSDAACRVIFHQVFVVAVCVAVLHLIAVAHNYSFPLEKHFFAEKKLV